MVTAPLFLSEKSHGQRSLVGYRPGGHRKSDVTKQITCLYIKHINHFDNKKMPSSISLAHFM